MENALLMLFGILFVVWVVVGLDWWGAAKNGRRAIAPPRDATSEAAEPADPLTPVCSRKRTSPRTA